MNKKVISASIVLYKTKPEDVKGIVESYAPSENRFLYIIDNSPERYDVESLNLTIGKYVKYDFLNRNIGYGAAHNIALRAAIDRGSTYHLILNPDITFNPRSLDELILFMDNNEDVVYLLPKVLYPNGDIQYLCKLLPNPFQMFARRFLPKIDFIRSIDDKFTLQKSGYNSIFNPPCLSGCFMLLRISKIQREALFFDERFFMYYEDFDLIRRCHRIGKTIYYPFVSIVHDHARQAYKSKRMLAVFIVSTIKYFNKYGWFIDRERLAMNKKVLREIQEKLW